MTKQPISDPLKTFGERIRVRRQELGLSQEQFAATIRMHWSYLGQIERGMRNVGLLHILNIAEGLAVDPGELIEGLSSSET